MANLYWSPAGSSPYNIATPGNYRTGSPSGSAASSFGTGDNLYFLSGGELITGTFSSAEFGEVLVSRQCVASFGTASTAITGAEITDRLIVEGSGETHSWGCTLSGIAGFTPANPGAKVYLLGATTTDAQFHGCSFEVGPSAVLTNFLSSGNARGLIYSNGTGITDGRVEHGSQVKSYRSGTYEVERAVLTILQNAALTLGRCRVGGILDDQSYADHTAVTVHPFGKYLTANSPSPLKTVTTLRAYRDAIYGDRTSAGTVAYTNSIVFGKSADMGGPSSLIGA